MTRLGLCALTVALAAGHCLAEPTTVDSNVHRFGDMEVLQGSTRGTQTPSDEHEHSSSTTTPVPTSSHAHTTTTEKPGTDPTQWLGSFIKAVQQQLQLQDHYLRQLGRDLQDFLSNLSRSVTFDETQSDAFSRVGEMMELINTRMTTARENVDELMATSENLDNDTLRVATNKFMKEVRVQDVLVDALWASLRGMQTSAWASGATVTEDRDAYVVANRAAEEFLTRMYHNLRAAGISEDDVVKFMPKTLEEGDQQGRNNMGRRARAYAWNYGGYYGYPSYRGSYGYGYNYPSYYLGGYGYGYPSYYGWYGGRRLRPNCPGCPPVPVAPVPPQQPMVPPFRTMGEEPMAQGYPTPMMGQGYPNPMMGQRYTNPMMGQNYTARMLGPGFPTPMMEPDMMPEYPAGYENMGNPMETMGTPGPVGENPGYRPFEMPGSNATGSRNLAPMEMPGFFEPGMGNPQFGFGPTDEIF